MNATNRLDRYLADCSARLRRLTLLRGSAALVLVVLVIGGVGSWFSAESGFAATTTNVFRILLVLAVAGVAVRALADPLQQLKEGLSGLVEQRVPEFNGRVQTYLQMKAENNPFLDLLAEDALKISARQPAGAVVPTRELQTAGGVLGVAAALLLYLLIAGPGLLDYSLRNLLAGWAVDDLLPPQSIAVTPGDQSVRRGTNVRVLAVMAGFDPDETLIHIQDSGGDWQDVDMVESALGFEFTFFSLQQDTRYYVSAGGIRSPEYGISVVEVPGIEALELTYTFPDWTAREPEVSNDGDIEALPETRIDLKITTTTPLSEGRLVLNGSAQNLELAGTVGSSGFTVTTEGEYYLAAVVGGEQVRLSDDYFIRIAEDGKPELKVVKPGGDYNASSIEEVLTRIEAKDDYGLQTLALQYSVNGGEFQKVDLLEQPAREITTEHLFMLESLRGKPTPSLSGGTAIGQFNIVLDDEADAAEPAAGESAEAAVAAAEPAEELVPLQPGDLISYYAEATDHSQVVRTDMFFIQVQPYNRRYSQSQLSGGGGGGGGGGQQQDEISQRQRQIIVSTWNLIREQSEGDAKGQVEINSKLLSELQTTLAEQAKTLADRTRARGLDNDEQIREFVTHMDLAVQSMYPASEQLAGIQLNEAIQPAQEALQQLLRAESVFNDITVSQQQGGGGGGGGRSSQDLAEMFELEMDLSLNQYETGNNVSPQQQQQQAEDIMQQLDELAQRQQQLANNLRNQQQLTDAQRYQQEMLRREAEQLREQLQQLQLTRQQQAQNGQQGQQGQQGQGGQQGQQGQQGQDGQQGQSAQGGSAGQGGQQGSQTAQGGEGQSQGGEQIAQSELQRRMDSALRAMNQAQQGMQGNLSPEEMQRAAEEASRQLQQARDQIAEDQVAGMQEAFQSMASRAEDMLREQERMEQQLAQAMEKAVKEREAGTDANSRGMSLTEEMQLAEAKRDLSADLQKLQQDMMNTMANYGKELPQANDELQRANNDMAQSEIQQAISDAALYIDAGYGLYIAGNESAVTAGMRSLSERLQRAEQLAESAGRGAATDLDRARQQVQDLRAQLRQLAQGGTAQEGTGQGQPDPSGQQQGQAQQGQPGQGQAGGAQQGGNQQANTGGGGGGDAFRGGFRGGARDWNGSDSLFNGPINLPENFYDNLGDFTRQARQALSAADLTPEELNQMYEMLRRLEGQQANRNDGILAQEYGEMLALIEQLEVGLDQQGKPGKANVRTAQGDAVPDEYQESVAEYFRRLSRDQ